VRDGSRITVHGDYDVDGICSTAILLRVLRGLGGDVDSYIPDRAGDGYGLAQATVDRLAERGTRLLITRTVRSPQSRRWRPPASRGSTSS